MYCFRFLVLFFSIYLFKWMNRLDSFFAGYFRHFRHSRLNRAIWNAVFLFCFWAFLDQIVLNNLSQNAGCRYPSALSRLHLRFLETLYMSRNHFSRRSPMPQTNSHVFGQSESPTFRHDSRVISWESKAITYKIKTISYNWYDFAGRILLRSAHSD